VVILDADNPQDVLPLKGEGTVGKVHWYLDDVYLTEADQMITPVIRPSAGHHRVSLIDSLNKTSVSEFTVVTPKIALGTTNAVQILQFD
jgi:membrane carboxypeptidase/penicillin-binding protein PbpC